MMSWQPIVAAVICRARPGAAGLVHRTRICILEGVGETPNRRQRSRGGDEVENAIVVVPWVVCGRREAQSRESQDGHSQAC